MQSTIGRAWDGSLARARPHPDGPRRGAGRNFLTETAAHGVGVGGTNTGGVYGAAQMSEATQLAHLAKLLTEERYTVPRGGRGKAAHRWWPAPLRASHHPNYTPYPLQQSFEFSRGFLEFSPEDR
jgi:hypothetical protein